MAKIVLTVDGTVLKELPLTKERVTIGRRSQNDLVIDHVAISGEHAAIVTVRKESFLEDLNSTNGTQVNGVPIKKHLLHDNDVIELAPYKIRFVAGAVVEHAGQPLPSTHQHDDAFPDTILANDETVLLPGAVIRVLDGPSVGKEMALTKPLTTIGRPGVHIAVIARRKQGYFITHVEGRSYPLINGESIGTQARQLTINDVIELSGTRMVFGPGGI